MITSAIRNEIFHKDSIIEALMSFKRSGASAIVTYFALNVAKKIENNL
jgi:delta-aminolevulinic acid dehydratase/porphobilinogen synthase